MRVLVASHSYGGNGAAIMLLSILEHWRRDLQWDIDVVLGTDAEVPEDLARLGVNLFADPDPKDYDFALVNTIISAGFVERFAPIIPTVLWVHEGESVLWSTQAPISMWRSLFEQATKVIFQTKWQSESVFRSFLFRGNPEHVACVRNGIPPIPESIEPMPKKNGMRRIVFIGGVYGRKRPGDLAEAVLGLDRSDVECVFVGSANDIETLGGDAARLMRSNPSKLVLTGEVDRLTALRYLASADVFCLPSADESQPIAPLEAASFDVPCVLSDLVPYSGIWKHGDNCLLHPVKDIALLRWNLRAALDDDDVRRRLISGGKALLPQFSINRFYRRFDAELPV
jgi:glycosyltransferase involved in cell wall biosynthesis